MKFKVFPHLHPCRPGLPCNAYWQLKIAFLSHSRGSSNWNVIYCLVRRPFIFWHLFSCGIFSVWKKKPNNNRKSVQPSVIGLRAGTGASSLCCQSSGWLTQPGNPPGWQNVHLEMVCVECPDLLADIHHIQWAGEVCSALRHWLRSESGGTGTRQLRKSQ